jgi:signal transduction histidine kinase
VTADARAFIGDPYTFCVRKSGIAALTIGVLLVVGATRAADLWWSRDERLTDAEQRAATLALILAEYLTGAFTASDTALRQLAVTSARIGGPAASDAEWAPLLAATRSALPGIGAISVIDTDGVIRHSTRREIIGQSRKREFEAMLPVSDAPDAALLGPPLRSPVEPRPIIIPIGRRITSTDGVYQGAVVASFVPAESRRFFQSLNVGNGGLVTVVHTNGTLLFREPSTADPIGEPAQGDPIYAAARRAGGSGTLRAPVTVGGPEMVTAFHATRQPIIVAVSLSRADVVARWARELRWSIWFFAVALILVAAVLIGLFRQMDAKESAEAALERARELESSRLREANERLAATLEREQTARRDAETASALKDQFLMTVSHELRTPLTAIAGWARLLVDGMVTDAQKNSALRTIERNAKTQTRLIEDLLDVSGIMTGKLRLDVRKVQLADVIHASVDAIRPAADAKGIELSSTVELDTGYLMADPERLQQVIWNLLSNAVKFTSNGGKATLYASRQHEHVEIVVTDTGIGIDPDFLPDVFDRFRQADSGSTRRHGGLGLGLAIVRNLVELHGGTVVAESDGPGKGARFTVRLPAPLRRLA